MFFESFVLEFKRNYTEGATGGDLSCRFSRVSIENAGVAGADM
jgi:hypothetical protein